MAECNEGPVIAALPIEYHGGPDCPRFLAWRIDVKVGRLERIKTDVKDDDGNVLIPGLIGRLAKGETPEALAAEFQTQPRILDAFIAKYQQEIDDAKNPPPMPATGGRP